MNTMLCRDNPAEAVRMYNELKERVAELEQALDELGVTPTEAKNGVERSRAKTARITELEKAMERIAKCCNWQAGIVEEALMRGTVKTGRSIEVELEEKAYWYDRYQAVSHENACLELQLAEAREANKSMHNMIMQIREHFNAWDTPTAPTDKDIVDCVIKNSDKQLAEARAEIQRWYDDACEASNKKTQDIYKARQEAAREYKETQSADTQKQTV